MKFEEFKIGQKFLVTFTMTESDFQNYISFARTRNILHENPELAKQEGISGTMLPGRSIISRAEGEMTRLAEFSDCVMLLYGMDGDPGWQGRQTRFLGEVYVGEELRVQYTISDMKANGGYGILAVDFDVTRTSDTKLVAVSRRNLYRIKQTH